MKQLKALFGLLVVIGGGYAAWQIFPVYYTSYEFQDFVESQGRIESYSTHNEQEIAEVMAKRAAELEIPLKADQIKVQKVGSELTIAAEYTVHVDLPIYPIDLKFTPGTKNRRM